VAIRPTIDASLLSEDERGRLELEPHLAQQHKEFFLSVITANELLHGVHQAAQPEVRTKKVAWGQSYRSAGILTGACHGFRLFYAE
jgi:hypothetical protein